jgi:hypothetical protein
MKSVLINPIGGLDLTRAERPHRPLRLANLSHWVMASALTGSIVRKLPMYPSR